MKLRIMSSESNQSFSVAWVEINTLTAGNFVIQLGHVPMVVSLAEDQPMLFRLHNGKQESMIIKKGIAEVSRTGVLLLIES